MAFLAIAFLLLPGALLAMASVKLSKAAKHFPLVAIAAGGILLSVASLEFPVSLYIAMRHSPEELAAYSLHASYIVGGLRYIGLLMAGIGLLRLRDIFAHAKT